MKPKENTEIKHADILVDGWVEPREKILMKHAKALAGIWMAGWYLKKGISKLSLDLNDYFSSWEDNGSNI